MIEWPPHMRSAIIIFPIIPFQLNVCSFLKEKVDAFQQASALGISQSLYTNIVDIRMANGTDLEIWNQIEAWVSSVSNTFSMSSIERQNNSAKYFFSSGREKFVQRSMQTMAILVQCMKKRRK